MGSPPYAAHPVVRKAYAAEEGTVPSHLIGIRGVLYDPEDIAPTHPGGTAFVRVCAGTDATALYETHHLDIARADKWLARLPARGTYTPPAHAAPARFVRYGALRAKVRGLLPRAADRRATAGAVHTRAFTLAMALAAHAALLACTRLSGALLLACVASAVCNTVCGGFGHNGLHVLHPSALLLDWNGLSAYEWLLEHVHSHHMHVNTPRDHDAISMRPFLRWLADDAQPSLLGVRGKHLIYAVGELVVAAQGNLGHRVRWAPLWDARQPWLLRLAPLVFVARVASHLLVQGVLVGTLALLGTLAVASFYFSSLAHMSHAAMDAGARAAEGDFVAQQLAHTVDLSCGAGAGALPESLLLYLDRQTLHHLFPTIDHSRLPALRPLLREALGEEAPVPQPLSVLHARVNAVLAR